MNENRSFLRRVLISEMGWRLNWKQVYVTWRIWGIAMDVMCHCSGHEMPWAGLGHVRDSVSVRVSVGCQLTPINNWNECTTRLCVVSAFAGVASSLRIFSFTAGVRSLMDSGGDHTSFDFSNLTAGVKYLWPVITGESLSGSRGGIKHVRWKPQMIRKPEWINAIWDEQHGEPERLRMDFSSMLMWAAWFREYTVMMKPAQSTHVWLDEEHLYYKKHTKNRCPALKETSCTFMLGSIFPFSFFNGGSLLGAIHWCSLFQIINGLFFLSNYQPCLSNSTILAFYYYYCWVYF